MRSLIHEITEHKYSKVLAFSIIPLGFLADALNNWQYYSLLIGLFILFLIFTILDIKKTRKIYLRDTIAIPIVINVDSPYSTEHAFDLFVKTFEDKYKLPDYEENLKRYLNIVRDDLTFTYTGDFYDTKRMISFVQIIHYQLNKIQSHLNKRVEFHLAYYWRPSIGFLIGHIFQNDSIVVYQKNPDTDSFDMITKADNRNYKTEVKNFKKFTVSRNENKLDDTVLLTIKASSHNIAFNSQSLSKYSSVVSMHANHDGTIQLEENWIEYAQEIFTVLNTLQQEYKKIVIAHSMPESLSVLVGMAIGNYWNITMTQYDQGEYKELIELTDIKYYF